MFLKLLFVRYIVLMSNTTTAVAIKFKYAFILAFFASPLYIFIEAFKVWLNLNIEFVGFVFGAVIFDHILGSWVHAFIKKDWSNKENIKGFFTKAFLVIAVYFLGRGIVFIMGDENAIALYFRMIARLMVFLYPAGSALVNCSIITKGKFPPWGFMQLINRFNKDLDLRAFDRKGERFDKGEEGII